MNGKEMVEIKNDRVLVSSIKVAKAFGKRHNHVLRSIRNVIDKGINGSTNNPTFYEGYKINYQNHQTYQFYYMTENGFDLISSRYIVNPSKAKIMLRFKKSFETAKQQLKKEEHKMEIYTDTNKISKETRCYTKANLDTLIRTEIKHEPGLENLYKFKGNCVWEMGYSGFVILLAHMQKPEAYQYKIEKLVATNKSVRGSHTLFRNLRAIRCALNKSTSEFSKCIDMSASNYHSKESGLLSTHINKFSDKQKKTISEYVLNKLFEEDENTLNLRKQQFIERQAKKNVAKKIEKQSKPKKYYTKQDVIDIVAKVLNSKDEK